ncbi:MAG TPA: PucR family transcriptional regulator ligand-binding domain-containing protein [Actinomycetota bacterium]|nr:PucR family transcriptional regulator ligand-binding domain-containing protein [Actinomycetota bacterium]
MAVTVADIVAMPGLALRVLAGEDAAGRPIRWVHASELEDPTPWLRGGELILTTGMGVGATPALQRAYLRRLLDAEVAGLGFGLGFGHDRVPRALVTDAAKHGVPLFEVPYPVPFIAITEAVSTKLLAEQYDVLQRAVDAQHALTAAVLEGEGVEGIAASLAAVTNGWVLLLDLHGQVLAATGRAAQARRDRIREELAGSRPEGASFSLTLVDRGHHVWVQPVGAHGRVEAFLAVGKAEQPSAFDRIVAGHALSLFAIALASSRAVAEAERRLRGDLLEELAAGALTAPDAARGLARFGFGGGDVVAIAIEPTGGRPDVDRLALAATDAGSRRGGGFLVSASGDGIALLLPADPAFDLPEFAKDLGQRVGAELRAGMGSAVEPEAVGRSLREARYALRVSRLEGWSTAGFEDLGSYRLLLSMSEPDALRAFADALLAPLDTYDREQHGDLLASLQAFLQHNARWETAATELYVHRHTLRYRMRKVEELTGRDLSSSFDRMEFWLALRARDLLATGGPGSDTLIRDGQARRPAAP